MRTPLPLLACVAVIALLFPPLRAAEALDTEHAPGETMAPATAAAGITLPPGFRATLFAGEPDVRQPIAMATDLRGRLWVAENYSYSERSVGWHPEFRDRILIFEDADRDGRFDRRIVFCEGLERLTSIELGLGGVWAICLPNLVFIPDRDGNDVPDGPPQIRLDGFEYVRARHNVANGLRWGPDGWLYGRQGILAHSRIGKPGTPEAERVATNVGIWRYHPQQQVFERFADGTTNPWGMDWNEHGELFFINTVIGHLWHAMPGGHFRRMSGDDPDPHVYEIIEQHADHLHWASGEVWTDVRKGVTDATLAAGGGHAHAGLLIYQGGQWPANWAGKLLTINFHGRRLNVERLSRQGSAFVGRREPDAFLFSDSRFRGLDLLASPGGGVYVMDWHDDGECHDNDGVLRSTGRIYELGYGDGRPPARDLARLTEAELVALQRSDNDWLARQARRALADRAANGVDLSATHRQLEASVASASAVTHRLRALWALQVSGGAPDETLHRLLGDREEYVRAWSIRLLVDRGGVSLPSAALDSFARLARSDPSPVVRLALASALQRLDRSQRAIVANELLARAEDANDHNLPLMLWYGTESLAARPELGFEALLIHARIPRVQRLGARRLAEEIERAPARVDELIAGITRRDAAARQAVLDGLAQGLTGRRQAPKPASWDRLQPQLAAGADEILRHRIRDLNALFGDGRAVAEIAAAALDQTADLARRRAALELLIQVRADGLRGIALRLLPDRSMSATAARGLALFDDPAIADALLAEWPNIYGVDRPAVLSVLLSRPAWAAKALDGLAAGALQRSDFSAVHLRELRASRDPRVIEKVNARWGKPGDDSERARAQATARWTQRLSPANLADADRAHGRVVFRQLCGACHILNGEGGNLGPDLTGAARDNLGYLLENILFPSVTVPDAYRLTTLTLKDGRTLAGMIRSRSGGTVQLQTMTELISLAASDVAREEASSQSLMPPGLLDALSAGDARDLIAHLMAKNPPNTP